MHGLPDQLLPLDRLADKEYRAELRSRYASAEPYPHIAIDGIFDENVLDSIISEFPDNRRLGTQFNNEQERKFATKNPLEIPLFTRLFIHELNSHAFIEFLEDVTGVKGLVADPHLVGGGLHSLPRDGKLALHTDFNYHKRLKLDRRINVLLYLNRDWPEEYGGWFEAWRPNGKNAEARYLPVFNRLVIFTTTDFTYHGNPDPVACPAGQTRKSIALYYYTNGRPAEEWSGVDRTTFFMARPGESVDNSGPIIGKALAFLPKPLRSAISKQIRRSR